VKKENIICLKLKFILLLKNKNKPNIDTNDRDKSGRNGPEIKLSGIKIKNSSGIL
jgi:hypothetical protein